MDIKDHLVENEDFLEDLAECLDGLGDPNQRVPGSYTLLHVAAQRESINMRVIQKLINAGADTELTTNMGHTPLQFAVMSRNIGVVRALIQAGAHVNVQNYFGRTALHYAVDTWLSSCTQQHCSTMHSPDMGIIKMLLDRSNIDVNPVDIDGKTSLMWAVKYEYFDSVRTLLKNGANPNIPNTKKKNCQHVPLSAKTPCHHIITELLLNGTGIYDIDNFGKTPIDILLRNFRNGSPLDFVKDLLGLIAFKYRIRENLECKVRRIPALFDYLKKACQEVELMTKEIIYDKMTLHDFASECFQERRRCYTRHL